MKLNPLCLAGFFCFGIFFPAPAQQVKVMQWNIHGNLGTTTAQSGAGAAAIGRILNYLQPDVLLINEVADGTAQVNTSALTQWVTDNLPYLASGTFYVAVSSESSDIQRNAAISRYPILSPFTYADVSSSLRGMHSFQLQLAGTNRLQVFHVLLKCCSDGTSCQTKQDEAQLFSNEIATWASTNSAPYIFAGDLNEDEANPECPGFPTISTLRDGAMLVEFKPTTLSGEYRTWSTAPATPSIRFDYILAVTNRLSPASGFVFSTMDWAAHGLYTNASPQNLVDDTRTSSDHYSVVATYNFPTNAIAPLQNIQTVFVIPMENQNWSSIKGNASAPYINNTLLPMASHAEQYFNPPGLHPSCPNYLWLEAGTNFNINSDVLPATGHQHTTNHLVTLLKNAGISWSAYNEDICGCNCPLDNTNLYVPRHNPMVYFDDVTNTNQSNSALCVAHVRPYTQFAGDLSSNVVARYNWIVPNLCDDMHNDSPCSTTNQIKNGDTWLANNLPAILTSPTYTNNGAIFILWDEGAGTSDGPLGMIVLSPLAKGGGYANSIAYTHSSTLRTFQEIFNVGPLLGDAANADDLSDLFNFNVGQLSVTPAARFSSSGTVGGPFNPGSQSYTLANSGSATLSWTATNSANWLTLSATSGTLLPGSNTMITASLNANANSLSAGSYSDTVSFLNANTGTGNTTRGATLAVNNPAPPFVGFFDDFSAFTPGNLVGQSNWTQLGTAAGLPLQVSGGQVTVPSGQTVDNQDAYKNFTQTNSTVFYGLALTVISPVTNASPSYFAALYTSNNGGGFANFRLTAKAGDASRTNFVLGIRVTGQTADPYTFGSTLLSTGAPYRLIVQAPAGGASMSVYVDPTSSDLNSQTPYASNPVGGGTPPTSVGSFVISQFGSSTVANDGISIGKVVVADSFATAYNALFAALSPFQTWQIYYFGSTNAPSANPGADPDGDGQNDWTEFLAGTDPTNSSSSFRITGIATENSDVRVTWLVGAGKTNTLQMASGDAGLSGSFTNLFTVTNTTAGTNSYLDTGALTNSSARYYRIQLFP